MSFCPSCGVQNTDDARFCNRCGTAISAAGKASAPAAAPSGPSAGAPPSNASGTVTLTGIGIQSPGRAYAILAAAALAFLGLGAGIAYVGLHTGGSTAVASTDTTTSTGDHGGDAIPEGVDVPDEDFVMTSGARVVKRGPSVPGTSAAHDATGTSGTPSPPTSGATGSTPPTTTSETTHASTTHAPRATTATRTGSGSESATSSGTATGTSTGTATGTSTGSAPPPSSSVDWGAMEGTVDPSDEPDYQMQMYSTQVRRFIRQYLLPQATSCFEHASAVSRDPIHGTVAIGFDIDARGHAQSPSIDRNTTGIDTLARCLQNNVGTWQLPPPPAGTAPIQMQMPFTR